MILSFWVHDSMHFQTDRAVQHNEIYVNYKENET